MNITRMENFTLQHCQDDLAPGFKALEKANLKRTRTLGVTDEDYFKNIEDIWINSVDSLVMLIWKNHYQNTV